MTVTVIVYAIMAVCAVSFLWYILLLVDTEAKKSQSTGSLITGDMVFTPTRKAVAYSLVQSDSAGNRIVVSPGGNIILSLVDGSKWVENSGQSILSYANRGRRICFTGELELIDTKSIGGMTFSDPIPVPADLLEATNVSYTTWAHEPKLKTPATKVRTPEPKVEAPAPIDTIGHKWDHAVSAYCQVAQEVFAYNSSVQESLKRPYIAYRLEAGQLMLNIAYLEPLVSKPMSSYSPASIEDIVTKCDQVVAEWRQLVADSGRLKPPGWTSKEDKNVRLAQQLLEIIDDTSAPLPERQNAYRKVVSIMESLAIPVKKEAVEAIESKVQLSLER